MADFLFEIGLEEVPARMIAGAEAELRKRVVGLLERERLFAGDVDAVGYSTPRRLAVLVRGVLEWQEDAAEELVGPAVKIAYKDGVPGPAAVAFARKAGVEISALKIVSTAKGDYVAATSVKAGRSAVEVLAEGLPKELAGIYWAKNMYWRAGKPERFVRPVRWMVALLGDEVVPVDFGGVEAGRVTFGHRVLHGSAPMEVTPETYADVLRAAFAEPVVEARRHTIRKALDRVCRTIPEARWREDHALVDKMTHLTEWPSVIAGGFEPEYLQLPQEVLVTVMRDHQNYFAVETKDGVLAPHFLAVLNTVSNAAGEAVIRHGNERVLRARFNDARFFWEFDQRVPLTERVALLEKVTFQKELGSYAEKSLRVAEVARSLGFTVRAHGGTVDEDALEEAARLCKTDLTTELVKEFTELQGEVGGLYGRAQGVSAAACDAMYDQYRPVGMEDRIPRTAEGQVLAVADKIDTIAGMFGLGMEPTGSKDPFALRRAANGIVRIVAEGVLPITLGEVLASVSPSRRLMIRFSLFFADRVAFYLREARGQNYDVVNAVVGRKWEDVRDAVARAQAVSAVRGSDDFLAIAAAFKRMRNILSQAAEKGFEVGQFSPLFETAEEADFWTSVNQSAAGFETDVEARHYGDALAKLASLRPAIDGYFDRTMVMDPDPEVRAHRLGTLKYLVDTFTRVADFSEIVVAG